MDIEDDTDYIVPSKHRIRDRATHVKSGMEIVLVASWDCIGWALETAWSKNMPFAVPNLYHVITLRSITRLEVIYKGVFSVDILRITYLDHNKVIQCFEATIGIPHRWVSFFERRGIAIIRDRNVTLRSFKGIIHNYVGGFYALPAFLIPLVTVSLSWIYDSANVRSNLLVSVTLIPVFYTFCWVVLLVWRQSLHRDDGSIRPDQ